MMKLDINLKEKLCVGFFLIDSIVRIIVLNFGF